MAHSVSSGPIFQKVPGSPPRILLIFSGNIHICPKLPPEKFQLNTPESSVFIPNFVMACFVVFLVCRIFTTFRKLRKKDTKQQFFYIKTHWFDQNLTRNSKITIKTM